MAQRTVPHSMQINLLHEKDAQDMYAIPLPKVFPTEKNGQPLGCLIPLPIPISQKDATLQAETIHANKELLKAMYHIRENDALRNISVWVVSLIVGVCTGLLLAISFKRCPPIILL
jgi:hypothetical protein